MIYNMGKIATRLYYPDIHLFINNQEVVDLAIPDGVRSLRNQQFSCFVNIKSVTLPRTIKYIGTSAFGNCKSLVSTFFLGNIQDWCEIYFEDKSSNPTSYSQNLIIDGEEVTNIDIPHGITKINSYAFYNCKSIISLTIPSTVTSIGKFAFFNCDKLIDLLIPGSVTQIGDSAFKGCTSLTSVYIPHSITEIAQQMFAECSTLDNVVIPASVTKINHSAFTNCISLKSITISNSVISIGSHAFENCSSLTTINLPEQIREIESHTFAGCSMLHAINIPNKVTSIKQAAFKNCTNLTNVTLPDTITSITKDAFDNCTSLEKIVVPSGQKVRFVQMGLGVYEHLIQEQEDETIALIKLAEAHAFAKDFSQAILYYTQAAEKGSAEATYQLAEWYAIGENLAKDTHKALQYYQLAAKLSYKDAQLKAEQIQFEIEAEHQRYNEQMAAFMNEQIMSYAQQTISQEGQPTYLFFDTECNGLPQFYDVDVHMTNNWPNVIQLAWIVTDEQGNVLKRKSHIITPNGFEINDNVANLTGITTTRAMREGIELTTALSDFMSDVNNAQLLIGHNIDFDMKVVGCELYRNDMDYENLLSKKTLCTMKRSTYFCAIPSSNSRYNDYKWPRLEELYHKLFGCSFSGAHDALADVEATMKCYFELKKKGIL